MMKNLDDFYLWGARSSILTLSVEFCQDMLEEEKATSEQHDRFFEGYYNSKEAQYISTHL